MRFLACATLLVLAGCAQDTGPAPTPGVRGPAAEVCSGKCCFGMHTFGSPPFKCEKCGAKDVPASHHYCVACAESLGKCPHCGGKRQPPSPEAKREVPPAPPPPPPVAEAPKAPFGDLKGDKLNFDTVKLKQVDPPDHALVAFVCVEKDFEALLAKHVRKEGPGEPPPLKSTDELVLYTLWGRRLSSPFPEALLDRKARQVGVTVMWKGTGMMKSAKFAPYAALGFKLGRLEPGEYTVGIWEAMPVDKDGPKLTGSIKFRVER